MTVSRSNWLLIWISLELNLLRFIPMIITIKSNSETEAAITYFLAQALGSAILLFARFIRWFSLNHTFQCTILISSLILKLGAAPFHFWFPKVTILITWINCLILITWQKVAPLVLLAWTINTKTSSILTSIAAIIRALTGGVIGINQTRIRGIIAFSSITHIGWIIGAIRVGFKHLSLLYFIFYSLLITPIIIIFAQSNINNPKQLSTINKKSILYSSSLALLFISLAGLPPLTGFLPKWLIITSIAPINPWLLLTLILGSFINLFFYLNIRINLITSSIRNFINNTTKLRPYKLSSSTSLIIATLGLGFIPLFIYAMTIFY